MTTPLRTPVLALAALALLAACRGEHGGAASTTRQPSTATGTPATAQSTGTSAGTAADTPGMAGMNGMGGMRGTGGMPGMMGGGMMGGSMMAQMQAHMRTMQGAGADSLKAMLPMHRQMTANLLAQMNGEMHRMNMPADARWTATVDSLRQDLVHMPEMSGAELKAMMPAHMGRVMRLLDMHRTMMGGAGQPGTGRAPARTGA